MTRHLTSILLGALGLAASCTGRAPDDAGSGGAPTASGGSGGVPSRGSGGTPGSGGSSGGRSGSGGSGGQDTDAGGSAGSAGAAGAPTCDCPEDTHITLVFPSGPRVYELTSEPDSCNHFPCVPPGASVSLASFRHDHYAFRACHPDGDCVALATQDASFEGSEGEITLLHQDPFDQDPFEYPLDDDPLTLEMAVFPGASHTVVEFTFEATSEAQVDFHGTGRACLVESQAICPI